MQEEIKRGYLTESLSDSFLIKEEVNESMHGATSHVEFYLYNSGSNYSRSFDLQKKDGLKQAKEYAQSLSDAAVDLSLLIIRAELKLKDYNDKMESK